MIFNLKEFLSFSRHALFPERGSAARLSPKRLGVLAAFYAIFLPLEVVSQAGLLLDDLLFGSYRDVRVEQPLFIVGNPRSGTTFLQRILARDKRNFTGMRLWEILLAPSILQRRAVHGLSRLDRRLGSPLRRLAAKARSKWEEENVVHQTGLLAPEEDQYLFIHIWSSLALWQFAAIIKDEAAAYTHFDQDVPEQRRERIMSFYHRAIQRHLHSHRDAAGATKHYLSKNPSATPKIASLSKRFPDARFVYLVRNPLDMLPSMISTLDYTWQALGDPPSDRSSRDYVLEMAKHWYTYPLEQLADVPASSQAIVRFNDLTKDPGRTVRQLYDHFGLPVAAAFQEVLAEATERSRNYKSDHTYSLSAMGLSRAQIVSEFGEVFRRFDFDTREAAPGDTAGPERGWVRGAEHRRLKPRTVH